MEFDLKDRDYGPVIERVQHYNEFVIPLPPDELIKQSARCMDCGIPYCHQGCPVDNIIPDWNDLVYRSEFKKAAEVLHSTNNFPEFTGRICPAPCEEACTLNIDDKPVAIKTIECAIIDRAWDEDWVKPEINLNKTRKSIAVIGSGPAGMACAQQLARAGHTVKLYEKNNKIGGLLRYGIPDFKMEKQLIDRRVEQMTAEGVTMETGINVGVDVKVNELMKGFDAVVLTEHTAIEVDDFALVLFSEAGFLQEGAVIVVGHETDFHAFRYIGCFQFIFPGNFPDLLFSISTKGKECPAERMSRNTPEHIRLIFQRVCTFF